jgi:hypothetical protein
MRKLSVAAVVMILGIAAYFTIVWGLEALRVLTSPNYGLDDPWRSQFIFGLGRLFGLGPVGLLKLAAFFGTLKLAVAVICAAHIADRALAFGRGKADAEILEGGLILVVLISIVSVGPAVWLQNADLVRDGFVQLMLAAVAAALCIVERRYASQPEQESEETIELAATPRGAPWYSPFR